MGYFKKLFIFATLILAANSGEAVLPQYETGPVGGHFIVQAAQTQTLWLQRSRHIKNLIIQAQGLNRDSMVEVMVNGEVKGTIYAPGNDPSYLVTVEETASSIQFRHRSGSAMNILNVTATMSVWSSPEESRKGGIHGSFTEVQELANRAIQAVEAIRTYSSLQEEETYLMPIKKKAGQVLVMSDARGDLSGHTITALIALQKQIEFANSYLTEKMEQEGLFDEVVELLSVREKIDDLVD